jgi:hypothetical protein
LTVQAIVAQKMFSPRPLRSLLLSLWWWWSRWVRWGGKNVRANSALTMQRAGWTEERQKRYRGETEERHRRDRGESQQKQRLGLSILRNASPL